MQPFHMHQMLTLASLGMGPGSGGAAAVYTPHVDDGLGSVIWQLVEPLLGAADGTGVCTLFLKAEVMKLCDSEDCWQPLEASPPPIPSDYRLLASQELSCSVQDYYHTVLSGTATFLEAYHRQDGSNLAAQGRSVFEATLGLAGASGFVRSLHFTQPRKAPNPRDADCVQRQQFAVFQGEGQQAGMPGPELLFATVMNTLQAPFHDCYTVNTITSVRPSVPRGDGREAASCGCCVSVYVQVHFQKSCLMGPVIQAASVRDTSLPMQLGYASTCSSIQSACGTHRVPLVFHNFIHDDSTLITPLARFYRGMLNALAQSPSADLSPSANPAAAPVPSQPSSQQPASSQALSLPPIPQPHSSSLVGSDEARQGGGPGWGALHPGRLSGPGPAGLGGSQVSGKSRPRDRQMRVMVVVLLLLGSLLHQALLHYDMDSIRQQLASVGMQVGCVRVMSDEVLLGLPLVADRVVLSHPGFLQWMRAREPYLTIHAGLAAGKPLSGRQLRQHFPQLSGQHLTINSQPAEVTTSLEGLSQNLESYPGASTFAGLWGFFQVHTSLLRPHKASLIASLVMARDTQLRELLMGLLRRSLGRPELQRHQTPGPHPPFETGPANTWQDSSGVFFVCPDAWFTTALLQLEPNSLAWARPRSLAHPPPTPSAAAAAPVASPGRWHPTSQEEQAAEKHQPDLCAGSVGPELCPADKLNVLWLCSNDSQLTAEPSIAGLPAWSWEAAALQEDLSAAAQPLRQPHQLQQQQQQQQQHDRKQQLKQHTREQEQQQQQQQQGQQQQWQQQQLDAHQAERLEQDEEEKQQQSRKPQPCQELGEQGQALHWPLDLCEADFWVQREADVLLASNSTFSFAAALLNHHQGPQGSHVAQGPTPQPNHMKLGMPPEVPLEGRPAGSPTPCWAAGGELAPLHVTPTPLFLRPDAAAGRLVPFDPWDALPIVPSKQVPANHSMHKRDRQQVGKA
ncbi:hypothetical protein QJQ45_002223 [Haematococcus lacustris]|nr:hypothetical protein QJQ45_002223 [Haematococcus lacustris]